MPLLTYGTTGDLAHSAIVMVVEAIPIVLFAPFVGTITDKIQPQKLSPSASSSPAQPPSHPSPRQP